VDVVEGVVADGLLPSVTEDALDGGALVPDGAGGPKQRHDVGGVLGERPEVLLAAPQPGVELRPVQGHVHVLCEGDHQPEVLLREPHAAPALHVDKARRFVLVEQRDADL
jgi:hypothetical protein